MRSIVIGALFDALPRAGVTCLRFNFRGVEGSGGVLRRRAAASSSTPRRRSRRLAAEVEPALPLVLAGWSFGADIALATIDDRVSGWFAVAPPLRMVPDFSTVAADPRPKLLALAEHDEFRDPASITEATASWAATQIDVVKGASHFFVGRTDRVVELAIACVDRLAAR